MNEERDEMVLYPDGAVYSTDLLNTPITKYIKDGLTCLSVITSLNQR